MIALYVAAALLAAVCVVIIAITVTHAFFCVVEEWMDAAYYANRSWPLLVAPAAIAAVILCALWVVMS